jgi:hypothetical protein
VKKVLVDGGSSINFTFPRRSWPWGLHSKTSPSQILPSLVSCQLNPLGHIYMPVTFRTLENYRTKFLRFEVAC